MKLQQLLGSRFYHALGCLHLAMQLAHRWDYDNRSALFWAALGHDLARPLPRVRLEQLLSEQELVEPSEYQDFPQLWHCVAGPIVLKQEFGVSDPEVAHAILIHATADADLGLLPQLIFLSDYLEPTRTFPGVEELRRLAFQELQAALRESLRSKLEHLRTTGRPIHPRAMRAAHWYLNEKAKGS